MWKGIEKRREHSKVKTEVLGFFRLSKPILYIFGSISIAIFLGKLNSGGEMAFALAAKSP